MPEIIESTDNEFGVWVRVGQVEGSYRGEALMDQVRKTLDDQMAVRMARAIQDAWRKGESVIISPPELFSTNDELRMSLVIGLRAKMRRVPGGRVQIERDIRSVQYIEPSVLHMRLDDSGLKPIGIVEDIPDYSLDRPIRVERVRVRP